MPGYDDVAPEIDVVGVPESPIVAEGGGQLRQALHLTIPTTTSHFPDPSSYIHSTEEMDRIYSAATTDFQRPLSSLSGPLREGSMASETLQGIAASNSRKSNNSLPWTAHPGSADPSGLGPPRPIPVRRRSKSDAGPQTSQSRRENDAFSQPESDLLAPSLHRRGRSEVSSITSGMLDGSCYLQVPPQNHHYSPFSDASRGRGQTRASSTTTSGGPSRSTSSRMPSRDPSPYPPHGTFLRGIPPLGTGSQTSFGDRSSLYRSTSSSSLGSSFHGSPLPDSPHTNPGSPSVPGSPYLPGSPYHGGDYGFPPPSPSPSLNSRYSPSPMLPFCGDEFPISDHVEGSSQGPSYSSGLGRTHPDDSLCSQDESAVPLHGLPLPPCARSQALIDAAERRRKKEHICSCDFCGQGFTRKEGLYNHLNTEKKHPCKKCGKLFGRQSDCSRHMKNNSCGKIFTPP
ncbi:hypothetical protein JAAARDRAFT_60755 [Jaapia argillacea MUCL 33604]|uniref:C2H2-type domain-containing protein n=1 Tax=Jaapia argillacea MUCL 33604 TaxID=933084 RepID=A0A067PHH8_9AGAM|nr:hypothetical protein JAAARDRAFT_60755 [Jaapia argillacea MUCL 33604]